MAPRKGPGKITPKGALFSFSSKQFFAIDAKRGNWVK